jgi:hypothetical protein
MVRQLSAVDYRGPPLRSPKNDGLGAPPALGPFLLADCMSGARPMAVYSSINASNS